ncbi:hypothetical protein CCYA_CCYA17G4327 [Cyanidiococcus yangmingshanensis]|nr:hypothetical protein CCYA_CCYA17G4327 [Cyanidiococcus yangmingshanensis]
MISVWKHNFPTTASVRLFFRSTLNRRSSQLLRCHDRKGEDVESIAKQDRDESKVFSELSCGDERNIWKPPDGLAFPVKAESFGVRRPSRWAPPAGGYSELPFRVYRTEKGNNIPVYRDIRGHQKVYTVLKRIYGRVDLLALDMQRVCDGKAVNIRPGPRLEVDGDFLIPVREWIRALGF